MREFFKMFFASLFAMVVAGIIVIGLIVAAAVSVSKSITENDDKKVSGNVLVLDLSKNIHEVGEVNSFAVFSKGASYQAGLYDILKAINEAKTDDNIKGILLKLSPSPNGWATMQQLQIALRNFKAGNNKFIYAYGENITQSVYFVASAADSIYLNPAGSFDLKGFSTVLAFFKGTLDKLELQPEIFYAVLHRCCYL